MMKFLDDINRKLQDKIAQTEPLNEPKPDKLADGIGNVIQEFRNLIEGRQANQFTPVDWDTFKNQERTGTNVTITKIDSYSDTMVFFLRDDDTPENKVAPIIFPCSDGNPVLIESMPLEGDKLLIEREGKQLPIVYNLTVNSYFISDFVDIGLDFLLQNQGIAENMLHLREQFQIQNEPNFLVRHIRQGVFQGVSSITNIVRLPVGIFRNIALWWDYLQKCRQRERQTVGITLSGQLVFSQAYSAPAKDDLKQHTIYMRLRNQQGEYINCCFNKMMDDYFDTPPDNSEIKVTGKVNILDGSYTVEQVSYGNYDIITGKDVAIRHGVWEKYIDHFTLHNIEQKIKIALKRYPKVWNANNPPAPADVLFYTIWGTDENGTRHMAKMLNPIGILRDQEEARVEVRGEFASEILGATTGIRIKEGKYDRPGGHGIIDFMINTIAGESCTARIPGRLVQHKVFKLKDPVRSFTLFKAPQYDPSTSYIPTWRFDENDLHFFIIEAESNNYHGFYAAYKKGVLNCANLLNEELLIKGGINRDDRVIHIEDVLCHGANLTSALPIPFQNAGYKKVCSIHGRVIDVKIETFNSTDYKDWLFRQNRWYRRDGSIELLKFYFNLYSNQNHTFDFILPVFYLDIRTDNAENEIIKCVFRPMWFNSELMMLNVNPVPLISINDDVEINAERDNNGYYKIKSISNKTNNTYGISIIDAPASDTDRLMVSLHTNPHNEIEMEGVVSNDMRVLFFGINPENFDFLKGQEYFASQHINVYNILPQQVIFQMKVADYSLVSCMAPLDLMKGFNGFDGYDERIPMQANMQLRITGKYCENGVFEINSITQI